MYDNEGKLYLLTAKEIEVQISVVIYNSHFKTLSHKDAA